MTTESNDKKTFVSSKGVELNLRPVSQWILDEIRTSGEEIPVPQYEMTIAGGTKVNHPMDEKIAINQGRLDEWKEYKRKKHEQDTAQSKRFTDVIFLEGVEVADPINDSEWLAKMELYKINVPTTPTERKLKFIYQALVGGEDVTALISQILSVSQIPEEAVRKIRDSFRPHAQRNTVGRSGKNKRKVEKQKPDVQ